MNNNTLITSKKYKTLGELLKAPIKSILLVSNNEKNNEIQEYLYNWLYVNHYSNIEMEGTLTNRVHKIANKACYYYIMNNCFDNLNIVNNVEIINILTDNCCNFIKKLHNIEPSLTGCFLDYLIRRIICEILNLEFNDVRASRECCDLNKPVKIYMLFDNTIEYKIINEDDLFNGKKLNLPNTKKQFKYNFDIIHKLEPNSIVLFNQDNLDNEKEMYRRIYNENEYTITGWGMHRNVSQNFVCSYFVLQNNIILTTVDAYNTEINKLHSIPKTDKITNLPINMYESYIKAKDTLLHKTENILLEIFITSLSHTLAFGGIPKEDKINNIISLINTTIDINEIFINPLKNLCNELLYKHNSILLNPTLGCELPMLNTGISADCDLVIDNTLIDIKCTIGDKSIYEILQLLAYSCLLLYNPKFNMKIDNIQTINLLQGKMIKYDISGITNEQLMKYLKILTNKVIHNETF